MGVYYDMLDAVAAAPHSLSFLSGTWPDLEAWKTEARAKVFELLAFEPPNVQLNPSVRARHHEDGVVVEEISYDMPYGPRANGLFLYPKEAGSKLPAVLALHDHGEFFYYGKEKLVSFPNEPKVLREYREKYYGGRSWGMELAKRGFAVLAVDSFLWGSRKIPIDSVNEELQKEFEGLDPKSEEYIRKYNEFWARNECILVVDSILNSGTNWPGIFAYEDRRSIDYLLTRSEVDAKRIGCGGLSMGGLRTIFLAGLDPRVRCAFCVGFMTTIRGVLRNKIRCPPGHGLLMYVPELFRSLDLPDVIGIRTPAPLLIQYNEEDELFTPEGQHEADQKITRIYSKSGYPNNYVGKFYPGPHKFNVAMQEDAFKWVESNLSV